MSDKLEVLGNLFKNIIKINLDFKDTIQYEIPFGVTSGIPKQV